MPKAAQEAQSRLDSLKAQAEALAKNHEALEVVMDAAWKKAEQTSGRFDAIREDLFALMRMLKKSYERDYTNIPWPSVILALSAILYFWNPFDAVPDFVLGVGLLDDATVIALCLRSLRTDLQKFKTWEKQHSSTSHNSEDHAV